ncbi:MAG: hypothetical protein ABIQ32_00420 [Sphingomicrobium sp.]
MTPRVPLRQALSDPALLGRALGGDTWAAWRAILIAAMGEPLEAAELEHFRRLTGRAEPAEARAEELWGIVGRRGGKTRAMSTLAVYLACLCDWRDRLTTGERGLALCIAPDQRQAGIALGYAAGLIAEIPLLSPLLVGRTEDTLRLSTGVDLEVRSASFRRLRGPTYVAVLVDEAAFLLIDGSANPDKEILDAVRPGLATTDGLLAVISSPYGRRGEVFETYRRHHGPDGDPLVLVAKGASRDFNPSLPQGVIDRALARDPAAAKAEYLGEFRDDLEAYVSREAVEACVSKGIFERPPLPHLDYVAMADPSGGRSDSMTLAIAHCEGDAAVLDLLREVRPPFNPESVVAEFAADLKRYRCRTAKMDRYGAEWVSSAFSRYGIEVRPADAAKSDLYASLLPALNSALVQLLDSDRLVGQLIALERRTSRSGKDSIDHPPSAHDDLANAAAGALVAAAMRQPDVLQPLGGSMLVEMYN